MQCRETRRDTGRDASGEIPMLQARWPRFLETLVDALWLVLVLAALSSVGLAQSRVGAAHDPEWNRELGVAMRATPDVRAGEDAYAPCGACHGVDGRGVVDGSVPAIAGQHFTVIAKQLVDYRHGRRWDMQMEHAAKMRHLQGGEDIADVAAYVSRMPRGFGSGTGPGEFLNEGARAYFRHCERCHGALGGGDPMRGIPRLAGQHYGYLYRQFFDAVEKRRPNMGGDHIELMSKLEREEIVGISDYLSRTSVELTHSPR
jgi:cytochrome c553